MLVAEMHHADFKTAWLNNLVTDNSTPVSVDSMGSFKTVVLLTDMYSHTSDRSTQASLEHGIIQNNHAIDRYVQPYQSSFYNNNNK